MQKDFLEELDHELLGGDSIENKPEIVSQEETITTPTKEEKFQPKEKHKPSY